MSWSQERTTRLPKNGAPLTAQSGRAKEEIQCNLHEGEEGCQVSPSVLGDLVPHGTDRLTLRTPFWREFPLRWKTCKFIWGWAEPAGDRPPSMIQNDDLVKPW